MIEIALTHGLVALVDDADADFVGRWKWHAKFRHGHTDGLVYARRTDRSGERAAAVYMHRAIMDPPAGMVVDHINGNGIDNRRSNLRIVTQAENCWNRREPTRGVTRQGDIWRATLLHRGRKFAVGNYRDEATALAARQYAEAVLRGKPIPEFDPLLLTPTVRKFISDQSRGRA